MRCHTNKEMLSEANFGLKGILVHSDSVPSPESYGITQSCTASVPWTSQIFYLAIVAFDERDNRRPINNLFLTEDHHGGKLDRVGPVDNRPSTNKLHHFVQKK